MVGDLVLNTSESMGLVLNQERKKSCAVIVTYNRIPNLIHIVTAISRGELDSLIISDNSGKENIIEEIEKQVPKELIDKVKIIRNSSNLGISKAVNAVFRQGIREGYYYFSLLDDDAVISDSLFSVSKTFLEKLEKSGEKVGVVCPVVSNNPEQLNKRLKHYPYASEVKLFINSGSLITAPVINDVGGYDEGFFLGHADIDLSHRLLKLGYKIYRINTVLIVQEFGKNMDRRGFPAFIYNRFMYLYYSLTFRFGFCNDLIALGNYYSPERERTINQGKITVRLKEKHSASYPRVSKVKFFAYGIIRMVFVITRETLLYFIFRDEGYLRSIVFKIF